MFRDVSQQLTQSLIDNNTIKGEEREIYRYGIQQGLTLILNLVTTLLIGLLCGMVWQSVVFTMMYIPLRSFAGGFHAKTPTGCYIFSIVLMFVVLLAMKFVPFTHFICSIMLFVSCLIIVLLVPVEDGNKPLDKIEQKVYRKRSLLIWIFELIATALCLYFNLMSLATCLTLTLTVMAVMLILGQLKNMMIQL
ncbi:MAG: accessory regulator AgrB [Ruminococcus sp.]|nr:accessory regulator AgrB [Ruminococcus sp.]